MSRAMGTDLVVRPEPDIDGRHEQELPEVIRRQFEFGCCGFRRHGCIALFQQPRPANYSGLLPKLLKTDPVQANVSQQVRL